MASKKQDKLKEPAEIESNYQPDMIDVEIPVFQKVEYEVKDKEWRINNGMQEK